MAVARWKDHGVLRMATLALAKRQSAAVGASVRLLDELP
jgi:hypothetical protein